MSNVQYIEQMGGETTTTEGSTPAKSIFFIKHRMILSIIAAIALTTALWCILFFVVKLNAGFSSAIAAAVLFLTLFMSSESIV